MVKISQEDFEATNFLAGIVGAHHPYLKRLAMVSQEERELMSYVECAKIMIQEKEVLEALGDGITDKEMLEFLEKIVNPLLEKLGLAKFKMGEISHLACKIGSKPKEYEGGLPKV